MMTRIYLTLSGLLLCSTLAQSFTSSATFVRSFSNTKLHETSAASSDMLQRRKKLLSRNGPYFQLSPSEGTVEFGSTATLVTKLDDDSQENNSMIAEWLSDERRVATSIWDENLLEEKGNSVYELKVMKLQFVTLQLQPSVDVKMWTRPRPDGVPVFYLQSVGFEPNVQILPGVAIDAKTLGIVIEVVGQLAPDGKGGVTGKITFQTSGNLPLALRILPESILKAASDTVNQTITKFIIKSFQTGAISKYRDFRQSTTQE